MAPSSRWVEGAPVSLKRLAATPNAAASVVPTPAKIAPVGEPVAAAIVNPPANFTANPNTVPKREVIDRKIKLRHKID